ncbi:hypothetical protein CN941_03945 [Bacillus cereus]|nr:hypothetical protein CON40_14985 [Bacillus cereus]PFB92503.1 hypothetical protein CN296_27445 [Bacillus cereus]PFJ06256.1 hypothetical protein COI88_05910 [Bacillus cereus]PGL37465.1 hypothetical protein CN930_15055 [Bacillus cereus]PGM43534.1 hypothetical protein CN941_03945 [Bacillus cereus]
MILNTLTDEVYVQSARHKKTCPPYLFSQEESLLKESEEHITVNTRDLVVVAAEAVVFLEDLLY